jgi:phenylpropionate dioxygenase-like ring-hydroxylating dioxygenase large terminal subunit
MGATQKYSIIDPATGKIDRRIFSDQAVYDAEMEKIFGRAWLMIGHESLVPEVNDFFHTYMGEDPVILSRDGQGRLHALLNMCRHRGNRVVRCDDGNATRFMCTYHGWTYGSDGLSRPGSRHMRGSCSPRGPRMPRASRPSWATRAGTWTPSSTGAMVECRRSAR